MKKNFLQDVVPPNHKRSIRDIPLPQHKQTSSHSTIIKKPSQPSSVRTMSEEEPSTNYSARTFKNSPITQESKEESVFNSETLHHKEYSEPEEHIQEPNLIARSVEKVSKYKNKKSGRAKILWISVFIIFLGVLFSIFGRSSATITLYAKQSTHNIDSTITLNTPNTLATKTQIVKTVSRTIPATQDQQIEQSAQGRIKITNTHKETPQELVKNTRFQAPNGLIYRIRESIEIPGYTMSGSTLVPGTLTVEVFADSTGEEYNISNTTFTIPGFSGMEQFEKITAETVGEIAGGYIGIRKVLPQATKDQLQTEMEEELKKQIENNSTDSVEYIIVPDLTTLKYSELKDEAQGNSVTLTLSATIDAYSLKKQELFNFIGQNTIPEATSSDMFVIQTEGLSYTLGDNLIKIAGNSTISWVVDTERFKQDLSGRKKSEVAAIISEHRSFERINVDLNPIWASSFPSDTSKINIVILK